MTNSVALRLGFTGEKDIRTGLANIQKDGTRAFDTIGDDSERAAARAKRAFDSASRDIESAQQRQARATATLAAFAPQSTNRQFAIDQSTNLATGKSARDSAQAFRELYAEADRATLSIVRTGQVSGSTRAGMQQLSYQISDVATSFAGGINPMVIFAQQGSQVVQSLALMRAGAGGLIGFLGGPWGAALMGAVSILGVMVPKLLEGSDASKKAAKGTKEVGIAATGTAGAVAALNAILARDPSDAVASGARNLAKARLEQANATYAAARSEAALRQAQGQARLRDLADGKETVVTNYGRGGTRVSERELSSFAGRAGSELSRERRLAEIAIKGAAEDLNALDSAYAKAKVRITAATADHLAGAKGAGHSGAAHKALASAMGSAGAAASDMSSILQTLLGKYDPLTSAADDYKATLLDIAKLRADGKITPEKADEFEVAASTEMHGKTMARFDSDKAAEADRLRKSLDFLGTGDPTIGPLGMGKSGFDPDSQLGLDPAKLKAWNDEILKTAPQLDMVRDHLISLGDIGSTAIDRITDPQNWDNMGDVAKSIILDIERELIRVAVADPLKQLFGSLFGGGMGGGGFGGGGSIGSALGGLVAFGIGKLLGFADGTNSSPAGWALVGERGPELARLPGGSRVYPTGETQRMMSGTTVQMSISIDATGADAAGLARVQAELAALRRDLPGHIMTTVADGQQRRLISAR